MGITGLLPLLAPISKPVLIQEYAGKVVAIDGHCWLHKGAFSCAMDLALKRPTTKYISHFMNLINMLRFYKVIPLVVFDGQPLPMKQNTNTKRTEKRKEAYETGMKLIKEGKSQEALSYLQQSVSITKDMIQQVAKKLDEIDVQYIIAPYEADPQLAYLLKKHYVQAVITEDSDLLAFGCSTVIFKLNRYGEGIRIYFDDIPEVIDIKPFTVATLRHICMLSGCDYLPSLKGIGLKTAKSLIKSHLTIEKVMRALRYKKNIQTYAQDFERAEAAFLYQYVYDNKYKTLVRLNELPEDFRQNLLSTLGPDPKEATKEVCINDSAESMSRFWNVDNKENIPPWLKLQEKSDSCKSSASPSPPSQTVLPQSFPANQVSLANRFKSAIQTKPIVTKENMKQKTLCAAPLEIKLRFPSIKRKLSLSSNQSGSSSSLPSLTSESTASSHDENTGPPITPLKRKLVEDTNHVNKKRILGSITNIRRML